MSNQCQKIITYVTLFICLQNNKFLLPTSFFSIYLFVFIYAIIYI